MADLKKRVRKGTGKVAFMAHLEGIKKMLDAGYPMISVFEEYEKKLSIKSGQFGKYVRKYVKGEVNNDSNHKQAKETTVPRKPGGVPFKRNTRDDLVG
jgi:hypothetical protein